MNNHPVYFSEGSLLRGDDPIGYAPHDNPRAAADVLRKEISTWHGYAAPPPDLEKVENTRIEWVGRWAEKRYRKEDGEVECTGNRF